MDGVGMFEVDIEVEKVGEFDGIIELDDVRVLVDFVED